MVVIFRASTPGRDAGASGEQREEEVCIEGIAESPLHHGYGTYVLNPPPSFMRCHCCSVPQVAAAPVVEEERPEATWEWRE